tara:strand:+ start:57412 stop:58743 length:1332 start_codon:yes stop_codon:yes gene_type:complete
MNLIIIIFIILLQSSFTIAQSIPNNHLFYQSRKLFYDAGKDWNSLTIFGPIRFISKPQNKLREEKPVINFNGQINFNAKSKSYSLNGYGYFKHIDYYGFIYPEFVRQEDTNHFIPSLVNNNNNHSGIGFENSWATLQIGRGRESWGSGNDIQLALSEKSSTYDYFLLGSNYGNIRVRYIYGFLENVKTNINRYITARGFEWTNKKSLVIGFSETVIYSGENRSFDIGYMNPISSHLEIELNNRLNIVGDRNSNAVWQAHLDYLMSENFRVSLNYLLDEFVIDQDIQIGKEHGKAYSIRFAYTPLFSNSHIVTLFSSLVNVGTPTFRHGIGTNNFVHGGRPLGWYRGSDGQEICIGMNYFNNNNYISSISTGILVSGEETIANRVFEPYSDYLKGPFPSGNVKEITYAETNFTFWWKKDYSISGFFHWSLGRKIIDISLHVPIF